MPLLTTHPVILRAEVVAALMPPDARRWFDLRVVERTGSTNSDLLRDAEHLPSGSVLAADEQTAGRGRRGRAWFAPPGGSLTFSVLWKFAGNAAVLSGLSLAVGVAVARAVEREGVRGVCLKWPNDLVALRGTAWCKAGGILIELAATASGAADAVIGIGLNLDIGGAAGAIDQPVTDLRSLGWREGEAAGPAISAGVRSAAGSTAESVAGSTAESVAGSTAESGAASTAESGAASTAESAGGSAALREALLAQILAQLADILPAFAQSGFAPLAGEWNQRHAWPGMAVRLVQNDQLAGAGAGIAGSARGVADDGALLIDTAAGVHRVVSGDVSLRMAPAPPAPWKP